MSATEGEGALTGRAQSQGTRVLTGGLGRHARLREAVSTIWVVRSRSDGGDQTGEDEWLRAVLLFSAAVKSPELRLVRTRVAPGSPELGREGDNAMANLMAGKRP
jgi:hypothetical protein